MQAVRSEKREKSVLLHQERVERYHKIHELHANKVDVGTHAHRMGMSRQVVYHYLKMTHPPERTRINQQRKPLIEPYKDYLIQRWNQGCRNAQQVHRELKEQGYTGSDQPIMRYFVRFRKQKDERPIQAS